ncbi:MAG TPA: ParB/RepB/Spo0J family partition protein [Alphaproteobacteria bacterium]|jgi:ParB family chromosome partitioning protein|nr:ParB/RepB/Spo0J family partition protein [Alphaproteobacteria bacterium]
MSAAAEDAKGRRHNLGRGIAALFGEEETDNATLDKVRPGKAVPVEFLRPGRFQPRRVFDETELSALADSIRQKGVLQPILVRRDSERPDSYEIIAGERRWRAAQLARLHEVPVIVRELDDREALEIALIENLQRQDLNPIEEAEAYQRLMNEFHHTQEALAESLGKSRSYVANTLRLLGLPAGVRDMVSHGKLTAGHARALIGVPDPMALADEIVTNNLNVRAAERLAQSGKATGGTAVGKRAPKEPEHKDVDTIALERDLSNMLGLKVTISFSGKGGELRIQYNTLEQLDEVLRRLKKPIGPLD